MIKTKAEWRWNFLNEQEAFFTANAANELRKASWAQKMLNDSKISKGSEKPSNPPKPPEAPKGEPPP